jgi:hypothetical protein
MTPQILSKAYRHTKCVCLATPARLFVAAALLALASPCLAAAPADRYTVSVDALTVLDNGTGRTWQRGVSASTCSWADAKTYCQGLNSSSFGGLSSGWRLPTVKELQSLLDIRAYNPAIDTTAFPGTASDYFWSSSPYATPTGYAWVVDFDGGSTTYSDASYTGRVRCVR